MELSDLKVFLTITEEGNISRAAERLGYVQSNVTARIRKLEAELGIPLFHRHPKGVTLTEKGVTFSEYAHTILNLSAEAVKVVQETSFPSGPLVIGVVETVTCLNFMNALAEYQSRYPDVSLSIWTGNSPDLLVKVLNHQLDGAFVIGDLKSPNLVAENIQNEELKLITQQFGDEYPDLANTRWAVSPKGCPFRHILEEWLRSEGISLVNTIEISSLETLISCVRSGLAATLLPASVLTGEYAQFGANPIPEKYRYTQTNLIRRKDRYASKAFTAFSKMIRETLK
ncbi:LysR family transcriptional regulator [Paenibacillus beijingensis]|uniref:Transcriptional regulator n=1 Tax=Paenibacillus beijingensis TaxID=1126833 RepID=A0A0D5NJT4_9BACL|nr:LysR family transcriptional regulator [Paenibacillus beijingensis]AJY75178.1 transcriptional regulator [Paenibacillus beijingensis]